MLLRWLLWLLRMWRRYHARVVLGKMTGVRGACLGLGRDAVGRRLGLQARRWAGVGWLRLGSWRRLG